MLCAGTGKRKKITEILVTAGAVGAACQQWSSGARGKAETGVRTLLRLALAPRKPQEPGSQLAFVVHNLVHDQAIYIRIGKSEFAENLESVLAKLRG